MRLLRGRCNVILQSDWRPGRHAAGADCLIALHARRSHAAIREWRERFSRRPLIVVLTGTDLYRDLPDNEEARESVRHADRLIVLQEDALRFIDKAQRAKARVVYQSARTLVPAVKARSRLNCILVGHLRPEKDPLTAIEAWSRLPAEEPVFLLHVGGALDRELGKFARAFARQEPRYHWVGAMPHAWTRQAIKRAHLLILPSKMEGGANVVVEAVCAGTPCSEAICRAISACLAPTTPDTSRWAMARHSPPYYSNAVTILRSIIGWPANVGAEAHCSSRSANARRCSGSSANWCDGRMEFLGDSNERT